MDSSVTPINNIVYDVDICTSLDLGCNAGSYLIFGEKKYSGFFNIDDSTFNTLGNGTSDDIYTVASTFSSANKPQSSMAIYIALFVALFLMFL